MCGIAGIINLDKKPVSETQIRKMNDIQRHRGPDDEGVWTQKNVGLGHRRLSIIDLSPAGHQPMFNEDKSMAIVFNGEIYNFLKLREELKKQGHRFRSKTDTEVIIHLYEQYGEEGCLKRLRGMFAFALWDTKKQQLFAARDRVGKKPLKYFYSGKKFVFASELKAILTDPNFKKQPDYGAIHHYLTFQYVPAPETGFKGIKKLPAAHYLVLKKGKLKVKRYWKLDYTKKLNLTETEWQEKILAQLKEAIKLRLISDVPLGAFLSGGIDSSAIVAIMSQLSRQPVKTFSIGFKEKSHDELPYARIIAQKFKTDHTELIIKPIEIELLPKLVWHYEEPYADSSALPTYQVSQLARKYVTVALNGDGGDENFAGYPRYNFVQLSALIQKFPKAWAENLSRLFSRLPSTFFERGSRFFKTLHQPLWQRYLQYICYFNNQQKNLLYRPEFKKQVWKNDSIDLLADWFKKSGTQDLLDQVLFTDFNSYLPDDLLVKVDIASMANALEGRSPFLDHKLLELTAQIPSSLKLHWGQKKYILKKGLTDILPQQILYRKKMGFGVPLAYWFRNELKDYIKEILLAKNSFNKTIFKEKSIEKLLNTHINSKIDCSARIWALLWLEHWYQEFFKDKKDRSYEKN